MFCGYIYLSSECTVVPTSHDCMAVILVLAHILTYHLQRWKMQRLVQKQNAHVFRHRFETWSDSSCRHPISYRVYRKSCRGPMLPALRSRMRRRNCRHVLPRKLRRGREHSRNCISSRNRQEIASFSVPCSQKPGATVTQSTFSQPVYPRFGVGIAQSRQRLGYWLVNQDIRA